jgi:hypothetical protein
MRKESVGDREAMFTREVFEKVRLEGAGVEITDDDRIWRAMNEVGENVEHLGASDLTNFGIDINQSKIQRD